MPLDAANYAPAETAPDLTKPSLDGLIYALRHLPEVLPEHEWSYFCRGTCAIGVADTLWPACKDDDLGPVLHLGMTVSEGMAVFYRLSPPLGEPRRAITPHHVADALEEIARRRAA